MSNNIIHQFSVKFHFKPVLVLLNLISYLKISNDAAIKIKTSGNSIVATYNCVMQKND